jgi:hypothetical protein
MMAYASAWALATNRLGDSACGGSWIFVFPDTNYCPARFRELAVGVLVAQPVALDLGAPEPFVDLGRAQMLGTAVPEAAIEEDRDLSAGED